MRAGDAQGRRLLCMECRRRVFRRFGGGPQSVPAAGRQRCAHRPAMGLARAAIGYRRATSRFAGAPSWPSHARSCLAVAPSRRSHARSCLVGAPSRRSHARSCRAGAPSRRSHARSCLVGAPSRRSHERTCRDGAPSRRSHARSCRAGVPSRQSHARSCRPGALSRRSHARSRHAGAPSRRSRVKSTYVLATSWLDGAPSRRSGARSRIARAASRLSGARSRLAGAPSSHDPPTWLNTFTNVVKRGEQLLTRLAATVLRCRTVSGIRPAVPVRLSGPDTQVPAAGARCPWHGRCCVASSWSLARRPRHAPISAASPSAACSTPPCATTSKPCSPRRAPAATERAAVATILDHLELPVDSPPIAPARAPPQSHLDFPATTSIPASTRPPPSTDPPPARAPRPRPGAATPARGNPQPNQVVLRYGSSPKVEIITSIDQRDLAARPGANHGTAFAPPSVGNRRRGLPVCFSHSANAGAGAGAVSERGADGPTHGVARGISGAGRAGGLVDAANAFAGAGAVA